MLIYKIIILDNIYSCWLELYCDFTDVSHVKETVMEEFALWIAHLKTSSDTYLFVSKKIVSIY